MPWYSVRYYGMNFIVPVLYRIVKKDTNKEIIRTQKMGLHPHSLPHHLRHRVVGLLLPPDRRGRRRSRVVFGARV